MTDTINKGVALTTEAAKFRALLVKWYQSHDGIADEMTYKQIDAQNERLSELRSVGIDPYEDPRRGASCAYCFATDHHTGEHLDECLQDDMPEGLRKAIVRIYDAYPRDCLPSGQSDPMYLANIIGKEMGFGDGAGKFSIPTAAGLKWVQELLWDIFKPGFLRGYQAEIIGPIPEDVVSWSANLPAKE